MLRKPPLWSVQPSLIAPQARRLWSGLAFIAPLWGNAAAGGNGVLLGPTGAPLSGAAMTAGANAVRRGTPYGDGVGLSGASNLLQRDNFEPIVTSDGAGLGDFTMIVLANPIAEARASFGMTEGTDASGAQVAGLEFNGNAGNLTGATPTAASGTFCFFARNGTVPLVTVASAIDGKYHLFGGVRRGNDHTAWIDGIQRGLTNSTAQDFTSGAGGIAIGQRAEGTSGRIDTACNIVLAAAWNRALNDAEMRWLTVDPFIMFRPYPEWRGVWTPLSGVSGSAKALAGAIASALGLGSKSGVAKPVSGSANVAGGQPSKSGTIKSLSGAAILASAIASKLGGLKSLAGSLISASGIPQKSGISRSLSGTVISVSNILAKAGTAIAIAGSVIVNGGAGAKAGLAKSVSGATALMSGIAGRIGLAKAISGSTAFLSGLGSKIGILKTVAAALISALGSKLTFVKHKSIIISADVRKVNISKDARKIVIPDDKRNIKL